MIKELKALLNIDDKQKKYIVDWTEYIYYALFIAMLLTFLDQDKDGFYQVIVVGFFFVLTGIKESFGYLLAFIKRYPVIPVVAVLYTVYYFLHKTHPVSHRFPFVACLVIFGGFCAAVRCKGELIEIYGRLWMILFAFLLIDIFTIKDKAPLYFKDSMLELSVIVFFGVLTLLYMEETKFILAGEGLIMFLGIMLFRSNEMMFSRAWKVRDDLKVFMSGSAVHKLLGNGYLQTKTHNTFMGMLSFYGIVAFALFILVIVVALYQLIFSKEKELKKEAVMLIVTLGCSAFYSMFSLITGAYLVLVQIGIFLGQRYVKSKL